MWSIGCHFSVCPCPGGFAFVCALIVATVYLGPVVQTAPFRIGNRRMSTTPHAHWSRPYVATTVAGFVFVAGAALATTTLAQSAHADSVRSAVFVQAQLLGHDAR
jgi:hypothetical protein